MFISKKKFNSIIEEQSKQIRDLKNELTELESSFQEYRLEYKDDTSKIYDKIKPIESSIKELDVLKAPLKAFVEREKMKQGTEPWVEVLGHQETDQGIQMKLDWNDAFIEELRSAGYHGTSEYDLVMAWLASVSAEVGV